jgi:DNA-binding NarL/FixJ family response regulator
MIRVCLVEDQTLVREGLESLLALTPDIKVIAHACDGEEARAVIPNCNADVVLLDVRMPKMSGIELLRSAQGKGFPPSILLTTFHDDLALLEGIRLGAKGYLLKDVSLAQLTEAIRVVAGGGSLINPVVTERLLRGLEHAPLAANNDYPSEALTDRETEVLRLMTGGYSNREIASAINLSEGTVKNHVSNILGKLGVRDRTRAVLKAIERGYI